MLTFEKVLEIFADYLTADETIEVYISRHGCVRVEFDQDFHYCSGEVCHTPKELFDLLADDYRTYLEIELTKGKREVTEDDERSGCPVQTVSGALEGGTGMKILKCLLMIVTAPVILVLTLFVWLCMGLIYISGLVLGLLSTVIALLGVAVLITYSPQNGVILLVMAFLISPMGLPLAAIWLLGKVQSLKFAIQDWVYG